MSSYIKPEIKIQNVVVEQLLASESGGQIGGGLSKGNDFWEDEEDEADKIAIKDIWK